MFYTFHFLFIDSKILSARFTNWLSFTAGCFSCHFWNVSQKRSGKCEQLTFFQKAFQFIGKNYSQMRQTVANKTFFQRNDE